MSPRDHLLRALESDLIGPNHLDGADDVPGQELLDLPPSRTYLTGFLVSKDASTDDPEVEA